MAPRWFVTPAVLAALIVVFPTAKKANAAPAEPQYGQYNQEPWEVAPREFNEIQRRGFHDGVEGARKDYGNNRRADVNNREEYRSPNSIPPEFREAYRGAFRRGYQVAASHLWNGAPGYNRPQPPPPPPQQPNLDWGMRGMQSDAQRRGFREGAEEARRDYQTNRRGDPDEQPQYRNPPVPPQLVEEYREGFMRGYSASMSQLSGESWEQYRGDPSGWQPPNRFTEWQRRGFHDGIEGARKDFGNHRRADPNNRWEYTNPSVPDQFRHEYREGFRRGYEMAATKLYNGM